MVPKEYPVKNRFLNPVTTGLDLDVQIAGGCRSNKTKWYPLSPEGYLGKTGDGYVRTIRVPFLTPRKSLKGVQNHKLVPERGPKWNSSLSKGLES